ncbi:putative metallo-beta-lactamase superfamily hydrolase [Desulfomicrobium macestii]|uniref:Metallo-beta-lactamase superfamily hydrolase n=1 Tax=Desulfomicrobium macestii TaxID=90731 RepID=A0ABR9H5I8_9BACT|nr:hypothetical protein [Desulfomicrobium macestii]MBE1425955.1 putative metallo-beta-lactamase superfamily hydrolase [Desulfomicrobium macestii]
MGMTIDILGTESLGVRGLCCLAKTSERRIVIDPGIALGYVRHGLLPHPMQIAMGIMVRRRILAALKTATDVVFSHFHGDHIPLANANPYQLDIRHLPPGTGSRRCWCPSATSLLPGMRNRFDNLMRVFGLKLRVAQGLDLGEISFSPLYPHGACESRGGKVMMTKVTDHGHVFVHASDIQLLDDRAVDHIIEWRPTTVFAAGPPLYRAQLGAAEREQAWRNAVRLVENVRNVILDHHLLRCVEGLEWLKALSEHAGRRVYCAAEWMGRPVRLLEARRVELYEEMPVPAEWHTRYASAETDVRAYFDFERLSGDRVRRSRNEGFATVNTRPGFQGE